MKASNQVVPLHIGNQRFDIEVLRVTQESIIEGTWYRE